MSNHDYELGLSVWDRWTAMWNGKPELALEMAAPSFVLHLVEPAGTDPKTVSTPAAARDWVAGALKQYTSIHFGTEAGPFVDTVKRVVAGPWVAEVDIDGEKRFACGMDTVAYDTNGKITEYWTMSKPTAVAGNWAVGTTVQRGAGK